MGYIFRSSWLRYAAISSTGIAQPGESSKMSGLSISSICFRYLYRPAKDAQ
jgi:hypothetical protein